MMRICSPQLGLSPNSFLGGEVCDREILKGLAAKGVMVDILLPRGRNYEREVRNWRISYFPLKHFPAFLFNFFIIPYLISLKRRNKLKIIRVHSPRYIGLGCLFLKIIYPSIRIYVSYHNFWETNFLFFTKYINKKWDYIFCDSKNVSERIIKELGIPKNRVDYGHNGVPQYIKPIRKDNKLVKKYGLENKKVLLYMGLFIKRKNPLFLLEVLKKILLVDKNIILIFVGQGSLEKEIMKRAKYMGLNKNVLIMKPVFNDEKNKVFNLADIFVHPSYEEGFAITPLEAMACKKPVIMNNGHSGNEVVSDSVNGYLCKTDDLRDWSKKILRLINDSKLKNKMGNSALKKAKKDFNWKMAIEVNYKIIEELDSD